MWKSGQHTRWEIVAVHTDGRRYLVCYTANKSQRAIVRAIQERGNELVAACGLPEDVRMFWRREPFGYFEISDWRVYASGRTQNEVQNSSTPLPYIGTLAKVAA